MGILFTKYLLSILEQQDIFFYYKKLLFVVALIVTIFVCRFLTWWWSRVKWLRLYIKVIHEKYLKKLLYIDNNAFDKIGTGNLIAIVDKWVSSWATILVTLTSNFWKIIITLTINIYFIAKNGLIYVPLFLVSLIVIVALMLYIDKQMRKWRAVRREYQREGTRKIVKLFMSKFDILQNNKINQELCKIWETSDGAVMANQHMKIYTEIFFLWPQVLVYSFIILFFYYGGTKVLNRSMTYAEFYGMVSALFLLQGMLDNVATVIKNITKDRSDVEKLWDLVDKNPQIHGMINGSDFIYNKGNIVFDNVWYAYSKNKYVIRNLSLHIHGKKRTALVWLSGAGKTTIIKLIAGYVHPIEWKILVDQQSLPTVSPKKDQISLSSYYQHIWYLTQEPSVFDGSVYENLIFALQDIPEEAIVKDIIEKAQCHFIYDLPHWLDTQIGEKWVRLSWWQRQRLAIAKIMLKNPQIVLLDEPTSALDSLSEEAVTKALDVLFENRTVIVVAHRLQTVKKADDIIVLEKGNIVERWTHNQLVAQWWQYAKMLELQSGF